MNRTIAITPPPPATGAGSRSIPSMLFVVFAACAATHSSSSSNGSGGGKADGTGDGGGSGSANTIDIAAAIAGDTFSIVGSAFDGSAEAAQHNGTFLTVVLPKDPFIALHDDVVAASGANLMSRGEAHVTVITPPEYETLKNQITMDEIDALAASQDLQATTITPVCLGVGKLSLAMQTVYVVATAPGLFDFRHQVQSLNETRGGSGFDADRFWPHATVGFTVRDLFIEDGIVKDASSCPDAANLTID
jgi:hypothetical protein